MALAYIEIHTDAEASHAKVRAELEPALRVFEELGDHAGLARALNIAATLRFWRGDNAGAIEGMEHAARHAREAGDRTQEHQALAVMCIALLVGPTPVRDALERLATIERETDGAMRLNLTLLRARAGLQAQQGRFDEAREVIATGDRIAEQFGLATVRAGILRTAGEIELLAGHSMAAERFLLEAYATLEESGDWGHLASVAPLLALVLLAQGRTGDAARLLELAPRWIIEDDTDARPLLFHRAQAKLSTVTGDPARAEALARWAVKRAAEGDAPNDHADALAALADVLELNGRQAEATAAKRDAIKLYERKGNLVAAQRLSQQRI